MVSDIKERYVWITSCSFWWWEWRSALPARHTSHQSAGLALPPQHSTPSHLQKERRHLQPTSICFTYVTLLCWALYSNTLGRETMQPWTAYSTENRALRRRLKTRGCCIAHKARLYSVWGTLCCVDVRTREKNTVAWSRSLCEGSLLVFLLLSKAGGSFCSSLYGLPQSKAEPSDNPLQPCFQ